MADEPPCGLQPCSKCASLFLRVALTFAPSIQPASLATEGLFPCTNLKTQPKPGF